MLVFNISKHQQSNDLILTNPASKENQFDVYFTSSSTGTTEDWLNIADLLKNCTKSTDKLL